MGLLDLLFGGSKKTVYLKELYANGAIIVDVRSADEFRTGHIKGSVNIPLHSLSEKIASLQHKKKAIITVCQSGGRSSIAVSTLKKAGLEAYNGGGWSSFQKTIQ